MAELFVYLFSSPFNSLLDSDVIKPVCHLCKFTRKYVRIYMLSEHLEKFPNFKQA
jgi:hypothetical protein